MVPALKTCEGSDEDCLNEDVECNGCCEDGYEKGE